MLSAREYLHVFGHYHYTNGVGGGGTHPTFNAKVAAPDIDVSSVSEDQEESVGIWIGKSGVRKPVIIREVNCKGPGNQQYLTWTSGKLSLWTASSGGSMLSGSSKYLSASQEYTYYAQGDMASGSIRDSEINTAYTAGGNTAYDKVKITVVGASFTPFSIIPVNTTQDVSVTLSPNPPGTNITLQLSCLDGSGSAVFAPDGSTSTNITQSTTVKIKGVTAGSVASNMILKAMLGNLGKILMTLEGEEAAAAQAVAGLGKHKENASYFAPELFNASIFLRRASASDLSIFVSARASR